MKPMYLDYFTKGDAFPFFIQYGYHDPSMFLHNHKDFTELVLVLSGTATHLINNERYSLTTGEVFVIPESTIHGYVDAHDFHICNIMFPINALCHYATDIKQTAGFHALFLIEPALITRNGFQSHLHLSDRSMPQVLSLIEKLHQEYSMQLPGWKSAIMALLLELIVLLSRLYDTTTLETSSNYLLAHTASFMEQNYCNTLSISDLAKQANISSRHFLRLFEQVYHMTPSRYLKLLRIRKATTLLVTTDRSVSQIAFSCGFHDSNYFSREFKKETGISPLQYRKKNMPASR